MKNTIEIKDLKIEKALEKDWTLILALLEEVGLTFWFTGSENYKDYYIVRNPERTKINCCFAITKDNDTGILKSVAVSKDLQSKGIGKYLVSKVPEYCKKLGIKKIYAATDIPEFWRKTFLTQINYNEIKDPFFLNYLSPYINKIPDYFKIANFFTSEIK